MDKLEYVGLDHLTTEEQRILKRIGSEELPKCERLVDNIEKLKVEVKTHDKGGKRKFFIINLQVVIGKKVFSLQGKEKDVKKSSSCDITSASHHVFDGLQAELKRKVRADAGIGKKPSVKQAIRDGRLKL